MPAAKCPHLPLYTAPPSWHVARRLPERRAHAQRHLASTKSSSSAPAPSSSARAVSSTTPASRPARRCKEEGYEVVLVNSNPATIMTDPEFAHRTYIEPITPEIVEKIIIREKPDALLPTLGGQTALNTAMSLLQVRRAGKARRAHDRRESRRPSRRARTASCSRTPCSRSASTCRSPASPTRWRKRARSPRRSAPCRSSSAPPTPSAAPAAASPTTGRSLRTITARGLDLSPVSEVLIEESLLGWKEFEMEVMRDRADNCVIICSIENLDPMGVHTGDSITVAPIQTLTDREYQIMRDASLRLHPRDRRGDRRLEHPVRRPSRHRPHDRHRDEPARLAAAPRSPRRPPASPSPRSPPSSPSATRSTSCQNDITRETPACFEPTIDYVVTKMPRFTFEKFPGADETLTTQMKSVGEAMAIGRTFKESAAEGPAQPGDQTLRPHRRWCRQGSR